MILRHPPENGKVAVLIRSDAHGCFCILGGVVYRPQRSVHAQHVLTCHDTTFTPGEWASFLAPDFGATIYLFHDNDDRELWYAHGYYEPDMTTAYPQAWSPA